jgi:Mg-chelatase subunit ChlD
MVKDELDNLCASIAQEDIDTVVLDSDSGFIKLGMAKHLSESLCARYMELESIRL